MDCRVSAFFGESDVVQYGEDLGDRRERPVPKHAAKKQRVAVVPSVSELSRDGLRERRTRRERGCDRVPQHLGIGVPGLGMDGERLDEALGGVGGQIACEEPLDKGKSAFGIELDQGRRVGAEGRFSAVR
jgi:hypothetical protein